MSEETLNEWWRHVIPGAGCVQIAPLEDGQIEVVGSAPGDAPPIRTETTIRIEINEHGELVLHGVQLG